MKASQNCINLIKSFEGCYLKAYKCPAGVWTIGYGHTAGVKSGQTITQQQAEAFLASDLGRYEKNVAGFDSKYHWTQNEFDALVSFAYNFGSINKLVGNGSKTKEQISKDILLYNKAKGKVLTGLVRRRNEEQKLFLSGSLGAQPVNSESSSEKRSNEEIAEEVKAGKWGNMPERKEKLEAAGYNYETIRSIINSKAGVSTVSKKSNEEIAEEVKAGKWGNMPERKTRLEAAGYNYEAIRKIVNSKK